MKKNEFIFGAIALSIGGVLAKIFSAIYRIGLTRILGGVGIGLYQLIFPVYSLCVILTTAGLPMAISKVVAQNRGNEKSVVKKCVFFTSVLSISLMFLLFVFAKPLAIWQGQEQLTICYIILAPSLIILSASSVLRGYFQGIGKFEPSAISSVAEQFVKLVFGLIVSLVLLKYGLIVSIIGAVVSIVISEVVSIVILLAFYSKQKAKSFEQVEISSKDIIKDVLPITITNVIFPIATFIDSLIVVRLLSTNFSYDVSVYLYGLESGAVSSFTGIPTIFSFALASVILPQLTVGKNKSKNINLAVKIVLAISVPFAFVFAFVPNRLLSFLYACRLNEFGLNGINIASILLAISGIGIVFLSLNQIFSSVLQAENLRFVTVKNLCVAVFVKFVIEIIYLANKNINIYSLAIANSVCYILVCLLNFLKLKKYIKINLNLVYTLKLTFCNCFMILFLIEYLKISNSPIITLIGGFLAIFIYFIIIYIFDLFELNQKNKYLNYKN